MGEDIPAMDAVVEALRTAANDLAAIANAHVNSANNTEEAAAQVDAEYERVANAIDNLAIHIQDLAANPRPGPESYSASI